MCPSNPRQWQPRSQKCRDHVPARRLIREKDERRVVLAWTLPCWSASFRWITILPTHASAARSAAGRPGKRTSGSAPVAMSGTRSTREASAQPACTSGLKPSAFRALAGRRIRIGTRHRRSAMPTPCGSAMPGNKILDVTTGMAMARVHTA
jgi:hypothetical protein